MYTDYELNTKNILNKRMLMLESDSGYINPKDERNNKFITELHKLQTESPLMVEPLTVFAILQKWGVENKNGRVYGKEILERENIKFQELIRECRAVSEVDHPESSVISVERIAVNITKTWWEDRTLVGEMEILMSPGFIKYGIISCQGDLVANLLRKRIRIGVSSRGVGSLKEIGGKNIVQDDYELICFDVVTGPSTPGSWIFKNQQEARPFMESEKKKDNLLIENLNKFLTIL